MTRAQQLEYLIGVLAPGLRIPSGEEELWRLFRSLVNIREPGDIDDKFLRVQDTLLQGELAAKGITDLDTLTPIRENLYLWRGDITTLKADAIVNAANSGLTGCYVPCHRCIDNAIHTYAGVQLRAECARLIGEQGYPEPTGTAKLTPGYNLPCRYILHTVGPIVSGEVTQHHAGQLASCYRSCLQLAVRHRLKSVAFCCVSTGEFHFPNSLAARIAVETVDEFLREHKTLKVVFCVFTQQDWDIYRGILTN